MGVMMGIERNQGRCRRMMSLLAKEQIRAAFELLLLQRPDKRASMPRGSHKEFMLVSSILTPSIILDTVLAMNMLDGQSNAAMVITVDLQL